MAEALLDLPAVGGRLATIDRLQLGLLDGWADYPRRAAEAEYLAVLRFEDEFELELVPQQVGTTSITYSWEIARADELCIRGRHTVVHVDEAGRPAPLSPEVRRALSPT